MKRDLPMPTHRPRTPRPAGIARHRPAPRLRAIVPSGGRRAVGTTILGMAALTMLVASGCGSPAAMRDEPFAPAQTQDPDASLLIDPAAAREIDYRVDWQYPVAGRNPKHLSVQQDSVFVMDESNYLTRIDREDGTRVWRIPISYPLAEIQDVVYLPRHQRVLVISGGDLFVLNASDGSQVERQRLEGIANTAVVPYGDSVIYGTRHGQLAWHSHMMSVQHRAYQIAVSIVVPPAVRGNVIAVVGNDGELAAIDANTGASFWKKKLLADVVAAPAIGESAVYVAGLDQYIWAMDINTGRNIWRYLTESALTHSPVILDDRLCLQVADQGLMCFEALPYDRINGVILWTNPDVSGTVITRRRENLVCWDAAGRTLQVITAARGGHVTTLELPKVNRLITSGLVEGELFASSANGKVVRLVPRN